MQTIQTSGEALIQLTNDILDFTRIEAGTLKLKEQHANPRAAVEDTLDLFGVTAARKGIELLHWIEDNVPAVVQVDDARLRQVLGNLVSNAVKFTSKGVVEVTLRAEKEGGAAAGRWRLFFAVRDTGIGIAPENYDRLFKPFSQLDAFDHAPPHRHGSRAGDFPQSGADDGRRDPDRQLARSGFGLLLYHPGRGRAWNDPHRAGTEPVSGRALRGARSFP